MSARNSYATSARTGDSLNLPETLRWHNSVSPAVSFSHTEVLRDMLNPLLAEVIGRFADLEPTSPITYQPKSLPAIYACLPETYDVTSAGGLTGEATDIDEGSHIGEVPGFDVIDEGHAVSYLVSPKYYALGLPWCDLLIAGPLTGERLARSRFPNDDVTGIHLTLPSTFPFGDVGDPGRDSPSDANPVGVAARIGAALGVTQHDVLHGTGIAERTYYDWKANRRQPRLASLGSLWALDQATTDIVRLIADPAAWMRSNPELRAMLQDGRFDALVAAALDFATSRSDLTPERAAMSRRHQLGGIAADNAVLDIDLPRNAPRRMPITPRRPRPRAGNDEA